MTSIIKVDQIQTAAGGVPTAADLGLNVGGNVLQVVQVTGTNGTNVSGSSGYVSVAGTCSITPTSATSKVLILHSAGSLILGTQSIRFKMLRNGVIAFENDRHLGYSNTTTWTQGTWDFKYLDTPASSSQVDYTFQAAQQSTGSWRHNDYDSSPNTWVTILMEIAG